MIFNVILEAVFGFLHILVTIDALCPKLQIDIPDIHTYNSNGIYPRRAITRELKRNRIIKRQIMRAKRKMPKISILRRRKREIDINQFFDEDPASRANRFLLKFMGFDISGGTAIPVEEHLGLPIEISHEEFIDLTKKHGKAAEGKVLEISEDEFNALTNKHGVEVEKTVEVINVPGSSSNMDWQNIPIGEVVDWTPLSSDDSGEWQSLTINDQTEFISVETVDKPSHHEIQDGETLWQNVPVVEQTELHPTLTIGQKEWQNVQTGDQTENRLDHEWLTISENQHPISQIIQTHQVIQSRPCSSSPHTFVLKDHVNYKNTECWVLPYFKNKYFSYVKCP